MAKFKDPLTSSDIVGYLNQKSSFAFELRTLKVLLDAGYSAEHAGTYIDPYLGKPRQFDIRARLDGNGEVILHLAVECKVLQPSFPLVVMCTPRKPEEAYHSVFAHGPPMKRISPERIMATPGEVAIFDDRVSIYKAGAAVGKGCTQIGALLDGKGYVDGDPDVYDKWAQALASLSDLLEKMVFCGPNLDSPAFSGLVPVLVVPDDTLWTAEFDATGTRTKEPEPAKRCSYYVGKEYSTERYQRVTKFAVSHIELMTFTGFTEFVNLTKTGWLDSQFAPAHIVDRRLK